MTDMDLLQADSAQFRDVLENMRYLFFKRERSLTPNAPLSRFLPICRDQQQLIEFENRYRREAK